MSKIKLKNQSKLKHNSKNEFELLKNQEKNEQEENEQVNSKEETLKNLLIEWIGNSTSHALPRLVKNIIMPLKAFWFTLMIISWCAAGFFVIFYFIDYYKYEVNVGVELIDERPTLFPTIDLCSLAPYDGDTKIDDLINEIKQNEGLGGTIIGDPPSNQQGEFFYDDLSINDVRVNANLSFIDLSKLINKTLSSTTTSYLSNATSIISNTTGIISNETSIISNTTGIISNETSITYNANSTSFNNTDISYDTTTAITSINATNMIGRRKKRNDFIFKSSLIVNSSFKNEDHVLLKRRKRSNSVIDIKYSLNLKLKSDALIKSYLIALENRQANGLINLTTYGYQLKDLLIGCKYRGKYCTANDFTRYHNYNYGNCFRFNDGKDALNQNVELKKTTKAGWRYGLQLELLTGLNEVYSATRGFRILIHNHTDDYVFPDEDGINVEPGKLTSIVIKKTYIERLETPFNDCLDDLTDSKYDYLIQKSHILDVMKNRFNYIVYNQNLCIKICLQKSIYEKCGCVDLSLPAYFSNQNGIGCNTRMELLCASNTETEFFNSDEVTMCESQCPNRCKFFLYDTKISVTNYPSEWFLKNNSNSPINETLYKTRVASIYLFYDQMIYKHIYQTQAITPEMLFANFGGQLGLFVGISLLSCIELIELVILIGIFLYKKLKTSKGKNHKPNSK